MLTTRLQSHADIRRELGRLDDELAIAAAVGGQFGEDARTYYEGAVAEWRWLLGEVVSPIAGLADVYDDSLRIEWRCARQAVDDGDVRGLSPLFVRGAYRALGWARAVGVRVELVQHPIPYR